MGKKEMGDDAKVAVDKLAGPNDEHGLEAEYEILDHMPPGTDDEYSCAYMDKESGIKVHGSSEGSSLRGYLGHFAGDSVLKAGHNTSEKNMLGAAGKRPSAPSMKMGGKSGNVGKMARLAETSSHVGFSKKKSKYGC
jgi:hypothetical protein